MENRAFASNDDISQAQPKRRPAVHVPSSDFRELNPAAAREKCSANWFLHVQTAHEWVIPLASCLRVVISQQRFLLQLHARTVMTQHGRSILKFAHAGNAYLFLFSARVTVVTDRSAAHCISIASHRPPACNWPFCCASRGAVLFRSRLSRQWAFARSYYEVYNEVILAYATCSFCRKISDIELYRKLSDVDLYKSLYNFMSLILGRSE